MPLLAGWAVPAAAAQAQSPIHRCVSDQGEPVFTDRTCADLSATPVTQSPATSSTPTQGVPYQPPPILCARDNQQLRQIVIDAFANQDANRLAGLMLWRGYGHRAAVANIVSLHAAMRQPLLDLDDPDDDAVSPGTFASTEPDNMPMDPYRSAPESPTPQPQLVVHTAGTDGSGKPHELRFDIIRRDGCLWLGHADY